MELTVDFLMLDPVFSRNSQPSPCSLPFQTGNPCYESMVIDITSNDIACNRHYKAHSQSVQRHVFLTQEQEKRAGQEKICLVQSVNYDFILTSSLIERGPKGKGNGMCFILL